MSHFLIRMSLTQKHKEGGSIEVIYSRHCPPDIQTEVKMMLNKLIQYMLCCATSLPQHFYTVKCLKLIQLKK